MKRRILAAAAAVLLAVVGAAALFGYVSKADQRAMAGQRAVSVLVVGKPIAKGTPADQLAQYVTATTLPAVAVAPTAVTQVEQLHGLVANADLQPGEQVTTSRFADPATLVDPDSVPVPKGMQELSLQLDPQRVVGGSLKAGDKVGVFVTVGDKPKRTHLVLNTVLVTRILGAPTTDSGSASDDKAAADPNAKVTVALALSGPDAEKVVFGQEAGTVWLSLQPSNADVRGTTVVTEGNVFK